MSQPSQPLYLEMTPGLRQHLKAIADGEGWEQDMHARRQHAALPDGTYEITDTDYEAIGDDFMTSSDPGAEAKLTPLQGVLLTLDFSSGDVGRWFLTLEPGGVPPGMREEVSP